MIGKLEMVIGQQQDPPIGLYLNLAGFGAGYARRQPGVAQPLGQVARQAHHLHAAVAERGVQTTLVIEQGEGRECAVEAFIHMAR